MRFPNWNDRDDGYEVVSLLVAVILWGAGTALLSPLWLPFMLVGWVKNGGYKP